MLCDEVRFCLYLPKDLLVVVVEWKMNEEK